MDKGSRSLAYYPALDGMRGIGIGAMLLGPVPAAIRLAAVLLLLAPVACTNWPGSLARPTFLLSPDNALLWQVSKPGTEAVSLYLLGSIHMLDAPMRLSPEIERAFRRADVLVLEIHLGELTQQDARDLVLRYGALSFGEDLSDFVSADTLAKLDAYLEGQGFTPAQIDRTHRLFPWSIALTLEVLRGQSVGLKAGYGVDQYFAKRAGSRPIVGLETIDEQMFALSSLSARTQEEMLRQSLGLSGTTDLTALVNSWTKGDAEAMEKILFPEDAGDSPAEVRELYETLYFARNARMADGLLELLEEDDDDRVFFAVVGAAHLIGDSNIRTLLHDAGYTATRVSR